MIARRRRPSLLEWHFSLQAIAQQTSKKVDRANFIKQCKATKTNSDVTVEEVVTALSKIEALLDSKNIHCDMVDMIEAVE